MRRLTTTLAVLVLAGGGLLVPTPAHAVEPCHAAGLNDFNGDGYSDAAVGDPDATIDGQAQAGRVIVLYGDADNRIGEGARKVLTADDLGYAVEAGDRFGAALATAKVDMDACLDLVVGLPGRDVNLKADAGAIGLFLGSLAGINGAHDSQFLTQAQVGGAVEPGDRFGTAVAAGENLGSDISVVVAGAPGEDLGGLSDVGVINSLNYSDTIPVGALQVSQNTAGVPGVDEAGDAFGSALALGFNLIATLGYFDVVVGAPGEAVGAAASAGSVTVISGIHSGDPIAGVGLTQNSAGVPGTAEANDRFGAAVATYGHSGTRRLVVGAPGEAVGSRANAGAIQLFRSTGSGLIPGAGITQDTAGVGGSAEAGDGFGSALAIAAGPLRVAVGAPGENIGATSNAGIVQVLPWSDPGADQTFDLGSAGATGSIGANRAYGSALARLDGEDETVLAVGVPGNPVGGGTGSVHVIGGLGSRSWVPGSGGIPAGAVRFGTAIGTGA